jgi:hypothetical protein
MPRRCSDRVGVHRWTRGSPGDVRVISSALEAHEKSQRTWRMLRGPKCSTKLSRRRLSRTLHNKTGPATLAAFVRTSGVPRFVPTQ